MAAKGHKRHRTVGGDDGRARTGKCPRSRLVGRGPRWACLCGSASACAAADRRRQTATLLPPPSGRRATKHWMQTKLLRVTHPCVGSHVCHLSTLNQPPPTRQSKPSQSFTFSSTIVIWVGLSTARLETRNAQRHLIARATQSRGVIDGGDPNPVLLGDVAAEHQRRTYFGGEAEVNLPDLTATYDVWHLEPLAGPARGPLRKRGPSIRRRSSGRSLASAPSGRAGPSGVRAAARRPA